MTILINDVAPRAHYIATAGQTRFGVPFEWLDDTHLKVWVNEILCTFDAPADDAMHYWTLGEDHESGGYIQFGPPGRNAGDEVIIIRDMPIDSPVDFPSAGVFPTASLNAAFDEMTAGIQQADIAVQKRTLRMADNDFLHPLMPIPMAHARANKLLGFDAVGQPRVYDGNDVGGGGSGNHVWTGDEPPPEPWHDGDLWWESDTGKLFVYYDDGSSAQWVEAGTSGGAAGLVKVADRTAMKLLPIATAACFLLEARREGVFKWYAGDYSAMVARDPGEGVYVASDTADPTIGVWVRPDVEELDPWWFGAHGNGEDDDLTALQQTWNLAGFLHIPCNLYGRLYNCSETLNSVSNLTVFGNGAVLYLTAWPAIGGFVTNAQSDALACVQRNVVLDGLILDGSKLPTPSPAAPDPGENTNLQGWSRGMYDAIVRNCEMRYIRHGYGLGPGGGGAGCEQGAHDCLFENNYIHHCYRGFRFGGNDEIHAVSLEPKTVTGIVARNNRIEECGTAILIHGLESITVDETLTSMDVEIDGVHARNVGHYPWKDLDFSNPSFNTIVPQKTGAIVIAEAQNVRIANVHIVNDADFTTKADYWGRTGYPAVGTNYIGKGLSGPIGAVIWGYGKNIKIENLNYYGNVDNMYYGALAGTFGDLSETVRMGSNENKQCVNWEINGFRQTYGTMDRLLDAEAGTVGSGLVMKFLNISRTGAPAIEAVGADMAHTNVFLETIRGQGWVTRGTAAEWRGQGFVYGTETQPWNLLGGATIAGGHSPTGLRDGLTWDHAAGFWRQSVNTTAVHNLWAIYDTSGLVCLNSITAGRMKIGLKDSNIFITSNAGTPEAVITAAIGSLCTDTTNGKLYVKQSGTGNTGWVVAGVQT